MRNGSGLSVKRKKEEKGSLRLLRCCEPISFMLGFGQYHHRQTTHLYCAHYLDHRTAPPFSPTNTIKFCTILQRDANICC